MVIVSEQQSLAVRNNDDRGGGRFLLGVLSVMVLLLFLANNNNNQAGGLHFLMSEATLREHIRDLAGDDQRLIRWDATPHTASRQGGGACDDLEAALHLLLTTTTKSVKDGDSV